ADAALVFHNVVADRVDMSRSIDGYRTAPVCRHAETDDCRRVDINLREGGRPFGHFPGREIAGTVSACNKDVARRIDSHAIKESPLSSIHRGDGAPNSAAGRLLPQVKNGAVDQIPTNRVNVPRLVRGHSGTLG